MYVLKMQRWTQQISRLQSYAYRVLNFKVLNHPVGTFLLAALEAAFLRKRHLYVQTWKLILADAANEGNCFKLLWKTFWILSTIVFSLTCNCLTWLEIYYSRMPALLTKLPYQDCTKLKHQQSWMNQTVLTHLTVNGFIYNNIFWLNTLFHSRTF